MSDERDEPIYRLVLTVEMHEPVPRDFLLEDIRNHVFP